MIRSLPLVLLLGWMRTSSVWAISFTTSYSQLCSLDSNVTKEFPVGNRRQQRGLGDEGRLPVEALRKEDEIESYVLVLDEEEDRNLQADNSSATVTFYQCVCSPRKSPDHQNMDAYCPPGYSCGVPSNGSAVECFQSPAMNGIAIVAWPIFLISTACLILIVFASMNGLAMAKYVRKSRLVRRYCIRNNTIITRDDMERHEQEEVDELLQFYRQTRPPEAPSRWEMKKFQQYQYKSTILQKAVLGFRREWVAYQKQIANAPTNLYLATKVYSNKELRTTPSTRRPMDVEEKGGDAASPICHDDDNEEEAEDDDDDDDGHKDTCSICFAEFQVGQRIGDLPCRHEFHAACLKTWIGTGRRNTCPLCQAPHLAVRRLQQAGPHHNKGQTRFMGMDSRLAFESTASLPTQDDSEVLMESPSSSTSFSEPSPASADDDDNDGSITFRATSEQPH